MVARVEGAQAWLESLTFQMNNVRSIWLCQFHVSYADFMTRFQMSYAQMSENLAGPIALLKQHITSTGRATAQDAVQVFGGRGITQSGMGKLVENYHRTSPFDAILGGAEDVMGDLGVRQALKKMPKNARL